MTPEQASLEAELRGLLASPLDEALLVRLEAAADDTLTQLSPEELRFEKWLSASSPTKLAPEFLASLESIVHEVPFAVNEKVVLFPKANPTVQGRKPERPLWAAAAAVALIGALSALMMPAAKSPAHVVAQSNPTAPIASAANPNFVPASFNRGLSEVCDEGVVWKSNNQAHSVVRVVYKDQITLKDANGRTVQVEQPRVEYMLVPAKTD
jgi:hypothetical protein